MNKLRIILRKISKARFFLGLFVVGLVFLIGGLFFFKSAAGATYVETSATITHIDEDYDASTDTYNHTVAVTYTVDGTTYNETTSAYSSSWNEGDTIKIYYDASHPDNFSTSKSNIAPYIAVGVGGVCVVVSIVRFVIIIVTPVKESNEFSKAAMNNYSEEQMEEVKNNNEPLKDYYFHYTSGFNQSYIFKTTDGEVLLEAQNQKLSVFRKYQYKFINHKTGKEEMKVCSHTVSAEMSEGALSATTDASFKIDDVNCWEALGKTGYSLEPHIVDMHMKYDVSRYGVQAGNFEQTGTNVMTGKDYKAGNIPAKGIYKVQCRESDMEGVFLACFIVARTFDL